MDHLRFKSSQTAAAYVADALDQEIQEAFELHMMTCPDCVEEVEGWRAIKSGLSTPPAQLDEAHAGATALPPREAREPAPESTAAASHPSRARHATRPSAPASRRQPQPDHRGLMAAALVGVALFGVGGGWYARSLQSPAIDSDAISFYSLPPLTRGPADCTAVPLEPAARVVAVRVPGVAHQQQLVAVDSEGHDLGAADYVARPQGDGSWLVRLRAGILREQGIRFEARSLDGTVEPRGCILSGAG